MGNIFTLCNWCNGSDNTESSCPEKNKHNYHVIHSEDADIRFINEVNYEWYDEL